MRRIAEVMTGNSRRRWMVFLVAPVAAVFLTAGARSGGDLSGFTGQGSSQSACGGGDPARAIAACTSLIGRGGSPATRSAAYNNRGFAHLRRNEFDEALMDLNQALELDPKSVR